MIERFFFINTEKITKHLWLYFVIVVLFNIFFRLIDIDFSSYWYDEIISIKSASEDFGHIKHVSEWDNNPPFYYYCLSVWIKLFDDTEFFARLLSVLFISFSGGLLFVFANNFFNKSTAFISSLLYLSSNILFFYSHEARAYSLVVLLSLISTFFYFDLKNSVKIKNVLLLGLFNFLLIYTHYIAGLVIVFQLSLALFSFERKQKKYFIYSIIVSILLTLIRFTKKQFLLILSFNGSGNNFWLKKADINSFYDISSSLLFNQMLIIPILFIFFVGIFLLFKLNLKNTYFVVLYSFLIGIGSILLLFLIGLFTPIFLERYLIFSIPFIILLIAYFLSFIKYKIIPIFFSVIFLMFSAFMKIDYKTDKGMDYRNVTSFIKQIKKNDDLVIVKTTDIKPLFCYYYERDFLKTKKKELPENINIIFCTTWNDINKNLKLYKRIIVVDSFEEFNPNEKEFYEKINTEKHKYATVNFFKGVRLTFYN